MDEQHAQLLPVPLPRLCVWWRAPESRPAPHSLSPPHPEIIGRHPTFSVKNHASAMEKKKTYNDLWTFCGGLSSSNGHFVILLSLQCILSVDFEIPEGWINWQRAGDRGQGQWKADGEGGGDGRTESLLGSARSWWLFWERGPSVFLARRWSRTNENVMIRRRALRRLASTHSQQPAMACRSQLRNLGGIT